LHCDARRRAVHSRVSPGRTADPVLNNLSLFILQQLANGP